MYQNVIERQFNFFELNREKIVSIYVKSRGINVQLNRSKVTHIYVYTLKIKIVKPFMITLNHSGEERYSLKIHLRALEGDAARFLFLPSDSYANGRKPRVPMRAPYPLLPLNKCNVLLKNQIPTSPHRFALRPLSRNEKIYLVNYIRAEKVRYAYFTIR